MIKKFEVTNYRGFKETLVFDLSNGGKYTYNSELIKNHIVNKALIYGKNASGKSNLGQALFDITYHLSDTYKEKVVNYSNGDTKDKTVTFKYVFDFAGTTVEYTYSKAAPELLINEKLIVDNELVLDYSNIDKKLNVLKLKDTENLNVEINRCDLSIIKYIYRNTNIKADSPLAKLMDFVKGMLWFCCANKGNQFGGYKESIEILANKIDERHALLDLEKFFKANDIDLNLLIETIPFNPNIKELQAQYAYNKYSLHDIASSGTQALLLFYFWSLEFDNLSFVFVDDFDAFYHYETAEYIIKLLNHQTNMQAIVSTHNTYLMNNRLTRPDCCFILSNGKITNLANSTEKELREGHNLEKMYRDGAFDGE